MILNTQTRINFKAKKAFIAMIYEGLFLELTTFVNISYFLKNGDFLTPSIEDA